MVVSPGMENAGAGLALWRRQSRENWQDTIENKALATGFSRKMPGWPGGHPEQG